MKRSEAFLSVAFPLAILFVALLLFYAERFNGQQSSVPHDVLSSSAILGFLDHPDDVLLPSSPVVFSGWALARGGVAGVEVLLDGRPTTRLRYGSPRPDVGEVHPEFPNSARSGFEGVLAIPDSITGLHLVTVEVVSTDGQRKKIAERKLLLNREKRSAFVNPTPEQVFHVLFATSAAATGGAAEIEKIYAPFVSSTIKVGIRVPILYLRTTKGRGQDWTFDADFDISRQCGNKILAEDSLNGTIRYAVEHQLPVLFTLNGGVWADARCDEPEWDINDALEQDAANCQWNERNEVLPDDFLKNAPGSETAPELARTLTFNVFSSQVRHYKKRNLQQAGRVIARFAKQHPHLFVGVNLDPDLYLNPFIESPKHWYDYNPDTLRQFREWLQGNGVYAKGASLSAYRRSNVLTLADVERLMQKQLKSWDEVDPPRNFPTVVNPFWRDPWIREWEIFRRHLVDLHYDELSLWLGEAGIDRKFIFSSQGFMAPKEPIMPFAVHLESETKNYDSGGMSVEGAVPVNGHLGAILYGQASINQVRMEQGARNLFSTFRTLDPGWGVVEYNTADFATPSVLPEFSVAYRSLRDIFNYGARFVSPMAWNGSNGLFAGQPGFASFTSVRNSPLEDAIKEFMISHADLPRGTRLWTFGAPGFSDDDGWVVEDGRAVFRGGQLRLAADGKQQDVVFRSPRDLDLSLDRPRKLILRGSGLEQISQLTVQGRSEKKNEWVILASLPLPVAGQADGHDGLVKGLGKIGTVLHAPSKMQTDQLRIRLNLKPGAGAFEINSLAVQ